MRERLTERQGLLLVAALQSVMTNVPYRDILRAAGELPPAYRELTDIYNALAADEAAIEVWRPTPLRR